MWIESRHGFADSTVCPASLLGLPLGRGGLHRYRLPLSIRFRIVLVGRWDQSRQFVR